MEISELVAKLESYRTTFHPSKKEYLDFLFEFNAKLIDKYYPNSNLCDHLHEFRVLIKGQMQQDLDRAEYNYYKKNRPFKLWVPPKSRLDGLVADYIKFTRKKLK